MAAKQPQVKLMCGIAGVMCSSGGQPEAMLTVAIQSAVNFMIHRGPDSQGLWSSDGVVLGSCRLAVQGLDSASNQPLKSADSECVVVFNGEIYNYLELRSELEAKGHRFASRGDTEVIVHAYEEWGPYCLQHFDGMFAFVIHDPASGQSFAARDRFGVKPLYYAQEAGRFLFASEPVALLETKLVSPEIDVHVLHDYLEFGVTDTSEGSFFLHIRQLPPGSYAQVASGEVTIRNWYVAGLTGKADANVPDSEHLVSQYRLVFESSLRMRLRSDVPIGILLSGGLDSAAIAGWASKLAPPGSIRAFTVSFPQTPWDEAGYAESVAARSGMPLEVEIASRLDEDAIRSCISHQQEPVISSSVVAQWLVMKAVGREHVKVLLSGQGADEYLGGYEYLDAYALLGSLRRREFGGVIRQVLGAQSRPRILRLLEELLFLELPMSLKPRLWKKRWLKPGRHKDSNCPYLQEFLGCRDLHTALQFHIRRRLPELLRYEDRNSMAFSIETRHPLLDFRLVELALASPPSLLIGEGVRKRLLRLALAEEIDPVVLARMDKIGFEVPPEWMESDQFRASLRSLVADAPEFLRTIIDFDAVLRLTGRRRSRTTRHDLWRVYNVLLWYNQIPLKYKSEGTDPAQRLAAQGAL